MTKPTSSRGAWGQRLGFVLAAAGSAIGLGNIWRFPTMAGQNGGAAFVLLYGGCVLLIGLPLLVAEIALGRHTQQNPVGAFARLASRWKVLGLVTVLVSLVILSYYSVVASWTVGSLWNMVTGELNQPQTVQAAFYSISASPASAVSLHALFMVMSMVVVVGGIQNGIERWSKVLMPVLLVLLLLLVVRSITLEGAAAGLRFYLQPDFSKVSTSMVLGALSQAFFSLSLGMGIMVTYGSYLSHHENIAPSAAWIVAMDTGIAFLAGFAIFPALFTLPGIEPAEGPQLIFLVLPNVFAQIPGGTIFGAGFFALLALAALTSSISLMEVSVACLIDQWNWSRKQAVLLVGAVGFSLGVPSALSSGAVPWLTNLPYLDLAFLDVTDAVFGKFALAGTSLLLALFLGWHPRAQSVLKELESDRMPPWMFALWQTLLRYVCPVVIALILAGTVYGL